MGIQSVTGIQAYDLNNITIEAENKPGVHAKLFLWTDRFSMEPYPCGKGAEYDIIYGE